MRDRVDELLLPAPGKRLTIGDGARAALGFWLVSAILGPVIVVLGVIAWPLWIEAGYRLTTTPEERAAHQQQARDISRPFREAATTLEQLAEKIQQGTPPESAGHQPGR